MNQTLLPNIVEFIEKIDPFDKFPEPLLNNVAAAIEIIYLARGEHMTPPDDKNNGYLYIIRTGSIEQRKPNGVLRAKLGPEDMFGFTLLSEQKDPASAYSVTAIENTLIYRISHPALLSLLAGTPSLLSHFAANAQTRIQSALEVVWSADEKGLFFKKVAEIASSNIVVTKPDTSIQQVAREMRDIARTSCAAIVDNGKLVGLITDKDMTKRVVAQGVDITKPVSTVMTRHPHTIRADDLVLKATSVMMQYNIRNLPVLDDKNQVTGLLTPSELVQRHSVQAIFIIDKINHCKTLDELAQLTAERQAIFEALAEGKVKPDIIGQVMAMIMDTYNRKLIEMAEAYLGKAPCEYTWIAAGSHARNEIHMLSDQDSAIVFSDSASEKDRLYFNHLAIYVCKGLAQCGYPLCSGRFMAATSKWCQRLEVWKTYYRKWATNPEYDMLLNLSVFLDIRPVAGSHTLFLELNNYLHTQIKDNTKFMAALVRNAISFKPPLGIFNNLVLIKEGAHEHTLNIKKAAINLLVDLARIYCLYADGTETGTEERFRYAFTHGAINEESLKDLLGTYQFVNQIRYTHQLHALQQGKELNNNIIPDEFGNFERKHLKDAFRIIANIQEVTRMRFC